MISTRFKMLQEKLTKLKTIRKIPTNNKQDVKIMILNNKLFVYQSKF